MPPTLARRYLFKLAANITSVPVYLIMEALLPRALGPRMYGNFSFATNLFTQFSGFLDMGTSTCFYNALSRRQHETSLLAFYLRISLLIGLLTIAAGFLLCWPPLGDTLMPHVPLWLAPLAALWALLTWWGRVLRSINDALGATIPSELWRAALSLAGVGLLALMFMRDWLNAGSLFLQQYLLLGCTAAAYWHVSSSCWQKNHLRLRLTLSKSTARSYAKEFFNYSHPLFVQAILSFAMLTAERWLLQWFDGSEQQGFFALSQKISVASFLFVSAMTPLLMRELSIAWGHGNLAEMGRLLARFAPLLYAMTAYFSCFTLVEGQALVELFGGGEFMAATLPVQIMALYPLHQAYGQMATSVFHASGKTSVLRNLTALECVYGLATAWFLLAPANLWGLNLGAAGLALKTVLVQFVSVNICLWLASRFIPFPFWRNLCHQLLCVAVFLLVALLVKTILHRYGLFADEFLARFLLSGILYSFGVGALVLMFPRLAGLCRRDLAELLIRFKFKKAQK